MILWTKKWPQYRPKNWPEMTFEKDICINNQNPTKNWHVMLLQNSLLNGVLYSGPTIGPKVALNVAQKTARVY